MKYINLLPPELQAKSSVAQRRAKPFSKVLLGCLIVPAVLILASVIAIIVFKYRYKQNTGELTGRWGPKSAAKKNTVVSVTARSIKRKKTVPEKQPRSAPEKTVSTVTSPKAIPQPSDAVSEKVVGFTIHVGAFSTKDEAEALLQKMMGQGLKPYQQSTQVTKNVNTIYVGQASSIEEAMEMTQKLEDYGYKTFIKIRPRDTNLVGIKGFPSRTKSREISEQLLALGYSTEIVPEQASLTIYRVNLGPYKEYRQAKETQNKLEDLGYRVTSIIRK